MVTGKLKKYVRTKVFKNTLSSDMVTCALMGDFKICKNAIVLYQTCSLLIIFCRQDNECVISWNVLGQ